jgi:hypothetical protein
MDSKYIGLIIFGLIIASLIYFYLSIFCQTKKYIKKVKQLKKLKLLVLKGRRKRGW